MPTTVDLAGDVLARLGGISGLSVLDSDVSVTPAGAYAVFYDDAPGLPIDRLVGSPGRLGWTFRVVVAGRDGNECRYFAGLVLDRLTGWRLPSAGSLIRPMPDGAPMIRDDSVRGDIRFSLTLVFRVSANRS